MLGDQNTAGLIKILSPSNCQVVRANVRRHIDMDDGGLWDRHWTLDTTQFYSPSKTELHKRTHQHYCPISCINPLWLI